MSKWLRWLATNTYGPAPRRSRPRRRTRTPHMRARLRAWAFANFQVVFLSGITRYITTAMVPIVNSIPRKIRRFRNTLSGGVRAYSTVSTVSLGIVRPMYHTRRVDQRFDGGLFGAKPLANSLTCRPRQLACARDAHLF